MKKFICLLLSLYMFLSVFAGLDFSAYALNSSGSCGDNVTFTFYSSTGMLTINGSGTIESYSFDNQTEINSVILNDGITSIGENAFRGCTGLTNVYYKGSETDWNAITINEGNKCLTDVDICFNYIHVHTEVIDNAVPATCTEAGLTEGSHCSVCGEVLVAQTKVTAPGHQWDNGTVTKEGVKTFTCTVCGETKTEAIPQLKNGWYKENGYWYLYKDNVMLKYWQKVDGRRYYMNSKGVMVTGWLKIEGVWYYFGTGGAMADGWRYINKKWYYFNKAGAMQTSWLKHDGKWYYLNANGSMQTGWKKIGGKWYYFNVSGAMLTGWRYICGKWYYLNSSGAMLTGWRFISGKWYYLNSSGAMQANTVVGNKTGGYYWVTKNGSYDSSLRAAKNVNGVSWLILNGKAKMVTTESDKTLYRAFKALENCIDNSMTKSQKLMAAWNYIRTSYGECNPRIPHYTGMDWPVIYANDIFVDGSGNCMSYGAAFAYMAKAIGYNDCYACNSGGHGWAEIEGLVYDPEWSMHNFKYSYYALSYNATTDVKYKDGIASNKPFMHIEICE